MFRRWPFFQRLLSWTKPHAPGRARHRAPTSATTGTACSATSRRRAAIQPGLMDGTSVLPVAAGDGGQPRRLRRAGRRRGPLRLPLDRDPPRGRRRTATGSWSRRPTATYRCQVLVVAVGVAEPYTPPGPGMELTHPLRRRPRRPRPTPTAGCSSSASRTRASSSPPGCCRGRASSSLASPSQAKLSVDTRTLVGVRARYVQPYEDHVLGGGVSILDAAIDRIERAADGRLTVHLRRTDGGADLSLEVDDVISATGLRVPAASTCPTLGVDDVRASRLPAQTPWWESATRARDLLRGHDRPGRARASRSTACRPTRARSTARATTPGSWPAGSRGRSSASSRSGRTWRPTPSPAFVAAELAEAPELFHQRGYLARVLTADPAGGIRDDGVQPLAHVLDEGGPDALAATLEADGTGAIYPVALHADRRQDRRAGASNPTR